MARCFTLNIQEVAQQRCDKVDQHCGAKSTYGVDHVFVSGRKVHSKLSHCVWRLGQRPDSQTELNWNHVSVINQGNEIKHLDRIKLEATSW